MYANVLTVLLLIPFSFEPNSMLTSGGSGINAWKMNIKVGFLVLYAKADISVSWVVKFQQMWK